MKKSIAFSADHYFSIGYPHLTGGKPCQDHALSGAHGGMAYAVVSDGCSTGGNTDIGSRLITVSVAAAIEKKSAGSLDANFLKEIKEKQNAMMAASKEMFNLSIADLYATCLYVCVSPNGGYVSVQGDGVIVFKYRSGALEIVRYGWENNMPYYPAYSAFFLSEGFEPDALLLHEERCSYDENGVQDAKKTREISLRNSAEEMILPISKEMLDELSFVAVFSDGIEQIEKTELFDAVMRCLSYKKTCGEFVKRRMIHAIKEWQKNGLRLRDDIAVAVISLEHSVKEEEIS